ncbi:hypothetical protein BMA10247_A1717 [Burkholderia mallei NCTC 10247]|nr:hypothetical protein BMA10247_A1717 [Burkholderia mallei NCTC 10247]EEP88605.1 conserved hypothetical protein [Burkholderia mallei GB8 horse 4]
MTGSRRRAHPPGFREPDGPKRPAGQTGQSATAAAAARAAKRRATGDGRRLAGDGRRTGNRELRAVSCEP